MENEYIVRIEQMAERKARYRAEAYFWLLRALEHTRQRLRRNGHVSGRELLEGARSLALEEYGPMALEVFHHWGLNETEDVGRMVFDLVEEGLLRTQEGDSLTDFTGVYDFREAFRQDELS